MVGRFIQLQWLTGHGWLNHNCNLINLMASKSAMSTDQAMIRKEDDETEAATAVMERILSKVMSRCDKQDNQIDKMADIMGTMTDTIKSMKDFV
jgi:hypothetical protein